MLYSAWQQQHAYRRGIRTFMTADVYGSGAADEMLGRALAGFPRDSYCLVGAVGHDFYSGKRDGSKGFPRFTNPQLRPPNQYAEYLRMATEKSLARCKVDKFDCLLLHNPDSIGYRSDAVWKAMDRLKEAKLTDRLGIAPGPANGFTLDLILSFERFGPLLDWAMVILNPLEPWPGGLCLAAAKQHGFLPRARISRRADPVHHRHHISRIFFIRVIEPKLRERVARSIQRTTP